MRFFSFLILIIFCNSEIALTQPPCSAIQGMTPQTAIAVCGTTVFNQTIVNNCTNTPVNPAPCPQGLLTERSYWYKFHCYAPGTLGLGFLITPVNPSDDFDWALFDVTGHPNLNDIYNTPAMHVSSNISGNLGPTGCIPAGLGNINCPPDPVFNRLAAVQAGHDYMLMVTNWSGSGLGYSLNFTGGDAVISNNTPPVINSLSAAGCNSSFLKVVFSEDIKCSSITTNGSEFSFVPAGPVITNIISGCSSPLGTVTELTIQLQNPLSPGNYDIIVNPGTDGNTFRDACDVDVATGYSIPFWILPQPPPVVSDISYTGCAPTVLKIALNKPVLCNSLTAAGSEFSFIPGNPAIASIQSACTSGGLYTDTLNIVLQNPLPHGNYQLLVNNGTDGNTLIDTCGILMPAGYNFPFVIAQTTTAPLIKSFEYDNCKRDKLVVNFDRPVDCASLAADASDFIFTPIGPNITGIISNCGTSTYTTQVTLLLQGPMPPGQFTNLMIVNGSDGNTISDTCFSFITPLYTAAFQAPASPPRPVIDSLQYDKCNPSSVKVFYSRPILCSTISPDGSQFRFFPLPGPVSAVSATGDPATCSQGYTNWILVQFSATISTGGSYPIMQVSGSDGKTIIDTCNSALLFPSFRLDVIKPSAAFNSQVNWGCKMDTIMLSHPGGSSANSWVWNFSDGTSATGQTVSHLFSVATPVIDVRLIVSNGICSDTSFQTILLGNSFSAAFNNSTDTFCINTPVNFTNASTGTTNNYLWDFGDGIQFNGQNPPAHVYPVSNVYNVQLVVTDNYGCRDTASKMLYVEDSPVIDFTGLKPQYCTGNQVLLTRDISRNITSYVWDNGDGKTFANEVKVNFSYVTEAVYTITLTGIDKYCGTATVSKTVPVYAVPKVALGSDTVLCQSDRMFIGITPNSNYRYLWNTGATTSQIYTDIFTRDYTLTADNNGCRGFDAMSVKVLAACLIKVPGAFTPNADGLNDVLKALNADLAKNFSFSVFNRVGQLVFSTNDPLQGWDGNYKGNPQETGTFVWMLNYTDPWTGNNIKDKGTSILLR